MQEKDSEIKKMWYKSKTIIVNSLIGLLSLLNEVGGDFKDVVQENLPFLKDLDGKWYIYAVVFLVLFNVINRSFTKDKIEIKAKKTKK